MQADVATRMAVLRTVDGEGEDVKALGAVVGGDGGGAGLDGVGARVEGEEEARLTHGHLRPWLGNVSIASAAWWQDAALSNSANEGDDE